MNDSKLIHPDREAFAGRTARFTWKAFAADGVTPLPLGISDVVRFKISKSEGGAPLLDLKLGAANANGSQVTIDSSRTLGGVILGPVDTISFAGWYYGETDYVDATDLQIKPIVRGRIYFHKSQGGNTDLTS